MKLNKKLKKAFTLVEILIASGLLIGFLSLMTNFLLSFNKTNTINGIKNDMDTSLRKALDRLEKEGISAIKLVDEPTSINGETLTTGKNQMVFRLLAYDSSGNPIFDKDGKAIYDTVGLKVTEDSSVTMRRKDGTFTLHPFKLYFSLQKDPNSSRVNITNQAIISSLMPVDSTTGAYRTPTGVTGTYPVFSYFNSNGTAISSSYHLSTVIKIVLWSESDYGATDIITARRETEIKLRNYIN
jgi:hypothetical protein